MPEQDQFLDVLDRDEAERRFHAALDLQPRQRESVPLADALGRVLAEEIVAPVDVPGFDRANVDGYALRADDTVGADELSPRRLQLRADAIATGVATGLVVAPGEAVSIATGAVVPRGADAVVMVEHADAAGAALAVRKAVAAGAGITFAGTDIAAGETVLRTGELLTSRETGVLAALGIDRVTMWRRPRVAIVSTGDEIVAPGMPLATGQVYDSNAQILADAVRELGGQPLRMGIVPDEPGALRARLHAAIAAADVILLSGGTSKGAGDVTYRVVAELTRPGIVAHGVALKPGKPLCLAATGGKAVVVLPGFPTSAVFTFHEFVAPVIRALAGRTAEPPAVVPARLAVRINSEIGRTEFALVGLVEIPEAPRRDGASSDPPLAAYPMGQGSGSVTAFSRADGFITIDRHQEIVEAGSVVAVQLVGRELRPANLIAIGSHCVGLDYLLGQLHGAGWRTKFLAVGSTAGLAAAARGECDLAGIHLLDPQTGAYNAPFVPPGVELVRGYRRMQGVVFRAGDPRFAGRDARTAMLAAAEDSECVMVNRNQGSGTRILIDQILAGRRPAGYAVQARNHNAVAAAVAQGRADWGVAIQSVARRDDLGFLPLAEEQYDFAVPRSRHERPAVRAFCELLADPRTRQKLAELGLRMPDSAV